jgi:hypothetical protein
LGGPFTTNRVVVKRIEPAGADAEVWQLMQETMDGKWACNNWESTRIESEILTAHPQSNYVPYAILSDASQSETALRVVQDAIRHFPSSPAIEMLHLYASRLGVYETDVAELNRESEIVHASKRPTILRMAFGRAEGPVAGFWRVRPLGCPSPAWPRHERALYDATDS